MDGSAYHGDPVRMCKPGEVNIYFETCYIKLCTPVVGVVKYNVFFIDLFQCIRATVV